MLEPDQHLRKMLAELLMTQGYEVVQLTDSSAIISRVIETGPDVVILAEDALSEEGSDRIHMLRRLMDGIIVVLGRGVEGEVVSALLEGADIYISKPVNFRELLARVRAFRRRSELDDTA